MIRRMLDGSWESDLQERVVREVGPERSGGWGIAKTTCMPLVSICRETSALYLTDYDVYQGDAPLSGHLADALTASGLRSRMPRFQALTVGMRECAWRISVNRRGVVQYRPVFADMMRAHADPDAPDMPTCVEELRWRKGFGWCWDVLDVSEADDYEDDDDTPHAGPGPSYRVMSFDRTQDLTAAILKPRAGDYSGENYPYRAKDGTPVLPYVLYHAETLGDRLWNWRGNWETVQACLDLGVNNTYLGHVLKDTAFKQRYTLNCQFVGGATQENTDGTTRTIVVADPAVIMHAESTPGLDSSAQPIIGQFDDAADPAMLEGVISSLANRIAIDAGLPPADIQRMGGTAKSGYAIALSNEGKRAAARRFAPFFRPSDELLIATTAILINCATGSNLPESRYRVVYRDLPLSPEELAARRANVIETIAAGLMSRVKGFMELNPGLTEPAARLELAKVDADRAARASIL
jgi:hypothetical protein